MYLRTKEVARLLGLSPQTLYRLRKKHNAGPPWIKCGHLVLYPKSDFDIWRQATP